MRKKQEIMKIIYVTRFFAPEPGAASVRATECVRHLSELGHRVSVITGFPSYLSDGITNGYRNRIIARESFGQARVVRTLTSAYSRASLLKRSLSQAIFGIMSLLGGLAAGKCDAVVASSPPFTAPMAGWLLSRIKRAAFIFEVRDLYPQSAEEFGVIKNKALLRALTWVEEFLYRKADIIVCATQGIADDIIARGFPREKVAKVLNGVNIEQFRPDIDGQSIRRSLNLDDKQVVLYTGIFGRAHGLSVLLDAAKALREHDQIVFVLVGDGAEREQLTDRKRRENLDNVIFIEPQPPEEIPRFIACADVCFAALRDGEFTKRSVPVKMFEYMACARPVILYGSGEAAGFVRAADAGVCVSPNNGKSLADKILNLCSDTQACRTYGENGQFFASRHLCRRKLARDFEQAMITAVRNRHRPRKEVLWTNK